MARLCPGGPTLGCSQCANLDYQSHGVWGKVCTTARQHQHSDRTADVAQPPKQQTAIARPKKRWLTYHSLGEVFFAFTKQYITVRGFGALSPAQELQISLYNQGWTNKQVLRSELTSESEHQRHERSKFLKSQQRLSRRLERWTVPTDQGPKQHRVLRPLTFVHEGPARCKVCKGITCRCTGIYCIRCKCQMYRTSFNRADPEDREEYAYVKQHALGCEICKHLFTTGSKGAYKCSGGCYIHIGQVDDE